jgi:uncharacterized protein (DUF2147 family)
MRSILPRILACAALTLTVAAAASPQSAPPAWAGVWKNTNNTVHIRAAPCGDGMCGTVVWADDQTKRDVSARGNNIIGMQIFRNFEPAGDKQWKGKVYVPDVGITISGKITMADRNNLVATGCAFLGFGCQTRHWQRIS